MTKKKLINFYQSCESYYQRARENNRNFSSERLEMLQYIPKNARVLDVACGPADNAEFIIGKAFYYGLDISPIALKMAEEKYGNNDKILLRQGDAENLPYDDNFFDVVLSTYSLEHFVDPQKAIAEMIRVCRPGGKIILISPAWDNPFWVPPSLKKNAGHFVWRVNFVSSQFIKLLMLSFRIRKYFFDIIQPEVDLASAPDADAVYIVRVREIINYFTSHGCRVLFSRRYPGIFLPLVKPLVKNLKENILIIMASLMNFFYKYLNAGLFIVGEKQ